MTYLILGNLWNPVLASLPMQDGDYTFIGVLQNCSASKASSCLVVHPKTYSEQIFEINKGSFTDNMSANLGRTVKVSGTLSGGKIKLHKAIQVISTLGDPKSLFQDR